MATQAQFVSQMLSQLKALDPSISAEPGTPERKIIETVAQAMAEVQVDIAATNAPFDVDSKVGSDVDKLISIFGYGRQQGARAKGYATFSRETPAEKDITIPAGTQIMSATPADGGYSVMFLTSSYATLAKNTTEVTIPIECADIGTRGNLPADTLTSWVGTAVYGVTSVTNPVPTYNGLDAETDDEVKIRFKNTVFRNVSGTTDQFLGLGMSMSGVTKTNVVGPISRYKERIQIPTFSDSSGGTSYTTAPSSNQYIAYFHPDVPSFVTSDDQTIKQFYTPGVDFVVNSPLSAQGDSAGQTPSIAPNVTFTIGSDATTRPAGLTPGNVVIFEYPYISKVSRNNYDKKVFNCVDVFIDGSKSVLTDGAIPIPANTFSTTSTSALYAENYRRIGNSMTRPAVGNYFTPLFQQPVIDLPDTIQIAYKATSGSDTTTYTYTKGVHYWAVEDITSLRGTVRARNGIEWSSTIPGQTGTETTYTGPVIGKSVSNQTTPSSITVLSYSFDQNVQDLQAAVDSTKQVTSDVLAHKAKIRYFKPDVSVIYGNGADSANTNSLIVQNLKTFLKAQPFGSYLQLSDIIQIISNTPGVDAVDWTYNQNSYVSDDVGTGQKMVRYQDGSHYEYVSKIAETDITGNKLASFVIEPYDATTLKAYYNLPSSSAYTKNTAMITRVSTASAALGAYTVTLTDTSGIEVGQKVYSGYGIFSINFSQDITYFTVTNVAGNAVTFDKPLVGTAALGTGFYFIPTPSQSYNYSNFILSYTAGENGLSITKSPYNDGTTASYYSIAFKDWDLGIASNGNGAGNTLTNAFVQLGLVGNDTVNNTWATAFILSQTNNGNTISGNWGSVPTLDRPLLIKPSGTSTAAIFFPGGKLDFSAKFNISSQMISNYDYFSDIPLNDDEVTALPDGNQAAIDLGDYSSIITIREKTQNSWNRK